MNNTFEMKRFGQVIARDWSNYIRNYGISLLVWSLIPIVVWICTWIYDFEADSISRDLLILWIMFVATMAAAPKIYGKANLPREGVAFAMVPATNLEKFLSMILYCGILTPIIVFFGQWLTDTILTLLPFGGYKSFVTMSLASDIVPAILLIIAGILLDASIFMFGNMVFKKRKLGKTIACGVLIAFILTLLLKIPFILDFGKVIINGVLNTDVTVWVVIAAIFIVACAFFYATFLKIKNQKY